MSVDMTLRIHRLRSASALFRVVAVACVMSVAAVAASAAVASPVSAMDSAHRHALTADVASPLLAGNFEGSRLDHETAPDWAVVTAALQRAPAAASIASTSGAQHSWSSPHQPPYLSRGPPRC